MTAPKAGLHASATEQSRLMEMVNVAVAVLPDKSLNWTVKLEVPAADGVPVITSPVSVKFGESVPLVTFQVPCGHRRSVAVCCRAD